MTLIRVYFQSAMAAQVGINTPQALPDMMAFKRAMHVATVNNKLGVGEKKACKQLMQSLWGIGDTFFTEIDASIKKNCRKQQDVPNYLYAFQGYTQELMMLIGTLMKWKFRVPSFLKKALRALTEKTVDDVFTKNDWKDPATMQSVANVRSYQQRLGFSQAWTKEFAYNFIILAKRESRASMKEMEEKAAKIEQKKK